MPISVSWDNEEKTALLFSYSNPWTWNDLRTAVSNAAEFGREVPHEVSVINDLTNASNTPDGALAQFRGISSQTPDNVGLIIIAGGNLLTNTMISLFRQVYGERGRNWTTAKSVDEARAMIARRNGKSM